MTPPPADSETFQPEEFRIIAALVALHALLSREDPITNPVRVAVNYADQLVEALKP